MNSALTRKCFQASSFSVQVRHHLIPTSEMHLQTPTLSYTLVMLSRSLYPLRLLGPRTPSQIASCQPPIQPPKQIPTNSSRLIPPSPRTSNSSIMAASSSSCSPSPNSLATLLRSCSSIRPLLSASNSSNARRISSRGSRARMRCAAIDTNVACERSNREGPEKVGCCCCCCGTGALEEFDA